MDQDFVNTQLVRRLRDGDRPAMQEIYNRLYEPLFHFANRIIHHEEDANDIVAELFIKLWRSREKFENLSYVRGFLFRCCKNACIDLLRQRQRREAAGKELRYLSGPEEIVSDEEAHERALTAEVYRQAKLLPSQCRQVFELLFIEGKRNGEIAELLGITKNTVQGQRSIALRKLRLALVRGGWGV